EVAQPGVDGGDVGGGHRGVLPHGPDDPPMSSWTAGTGRRFLPRAGPSPPAADPPRRVPESARVSCMTTDTTPADHGRPVLGVEDPAELLAQTRLSLAGPDRKSTRLNSSHVSISYAVFCLKKKNK